MNPFYFTSSNARLLGFLHQSASAGKKRTGVVLCYPFGQEYIRAHRSFKQLAERICRKGYPVIRFDYFATGDSEGTGKEASVARFRENILDAANEMQKRSGADYLVLAGLRLGAFLAREVSSSLEDAAGVVLWDPVISGEEYLKELRNQHRHWQMERPIRNTGSNPDQVQGFSLSPELAGEILQLKLPGSRNGLSPLRTLIVTSDDSRPAVRIRQLFPAGSETETRHVSGIKPWIKYEGEDKTLVPSKLLNVIVDWICRQFP